MMCPTIAHAPDGTVAALGSGGSNRIRTAILQVLVNLLDHKLAAEQAVDAPRLHVEGRIASLEEGFADDAAAALELLADKVVLWPRHNLFFGGVHAVVRHADGRLAPAGDPRRGGSAQQT